MRRPNGTYAPGHKAQLKHGKRRTRIYSIWRNMRTRCENPNCDFYPDYGGRGNWSEEDLVLIRAGLPAYDARRAKQKVFQP